MRADPKCTKDSQVSSVFLRFRDLRVNVDEITPDVFLRPALISKPVSDPIKLFCFYNNFFSFYDVNLGHFNINDFFYM